MRLRLVLAALATLCVLPAAAQEPAAVVNASAQVQDWPLSTIDRRPVEARHWRGFDILPFIETLNLTLAVAEADGQPDVAARVAWRMGQEGVKRGRRVPAAELPEGVHLVAFVLRADVVQEGRRVAGLTLAVDSTRLAAGETLVLTPLADWSTLFDGVSAGEARGIVADGFALDNLQLVRAAFAVFPLRTSSAATHRRMGDETISHRSVYDTNVWVEVAWDLTWLMGPEYRDGYAVSRPRAPRGETGTGRGRSSGSRDEDEEDDDESGELLPAALMVGAAVAGVAVFGGTAGYVAQANEPIGVAAGYVRRGGGVLLQASANGAALGLDEADESLSAQLIGFMGRGALQPALGVGVRYHERAGAMQADPTVTPGAVLRAQRVSFLVGYEVFGGEPVFGLFYSWRLR